MFEGAGQIAAESRATDANGLRRVGWAELSAAISLSRAMRGRETGLLAQAGPSFGFTDEKDERGVNLVSLARRKASGGTDMLSAEIAPERHREKR